MHPIEHKIEILVSTRMLIRIILFQVALRLSCPASTYAGTTAPLRGASDRRRSSASLPPVLLYARLRYSYGACGAVRATRPPLLRCGRPTVEAMEAFAPDGLSRGGGAGGPCLKWACDAARGGLLPDVPPRCSSSASQSPPPHRTWVAAATAAAASLLDLLGASRGRGGRGGVESARAWLGGGGEGGRSAAVWPIKPSEQARAGGVEDTGGAAAPAVLEEKTIKLEAFFAAELYSSWRP